MDDSLAIQVLLEIGVEKYKMQDFNGAINDFTAATILDPNNIQAYSLLGGSKIKSKDFIGAYEALSKAISLSPDDIRLYNLRAFASGCLDNHQGTISDCSKVLEKNPN